jgi:hypothetical protein
MQRQKSGKRMWEIDLPRREATFNLHFPYEMLLEGICVIGNSNLILQRRMPHANHSSYNFHAMGSLFYPLALEHRTGHVAVIETHVQTLSIFQGNLVVVPRAFDGKYPP